MGISNVVYLRFMDLWIYGFMDLWIYGFMDLWMIGWSLLLAMQIGYRI